MCIYVGSRHAGPCGSEDNWGVLSLSSPALWLWERELVSMPPSAHTGSLTALCWLLTEEK